MYNSWPIQTQPSLELKTLPRFHPVSLSLSMNHQIFLYRKSQFYEMGELTLLPVVPVVYIICHNQQFLGFIAGEGCESISSVLR